ncbi:MAG: O-antigen ligase family protein [Bacteroidales bacterium]|nr:O-antigen ligase family protein [Bacteroidales bacterium]
MASVRSWFLRHWQMLLAVAFSLAFIVVNGLCLSKDIYYVSYVPMALLVLFFFVVKIEYVWLSMALLTPFAINVALFPQMELSMPVEPMMIVFTAMFIFRTMLSRGYDKRILRHPVSIAVMVSIAWMLITSAFSELPWVSFKYTLARLWFVVPFFFAAAQLFRNQQRIKQFFWCYAIGLIAVILIATIKTLSNFSDLQTMHHVMSPFYNDHTAYGCAIALMLPAAFYMLFADKGRPVTRLLAVAMFGLLAMGLFFSYCRAAWVSVAAVIGMYVLIRMGVKLKWMALMAALAVGLFFAYQGDILYKMGKNHQDSSYDVADQVKSISNIATDASNLERLNRWASAFRLWQEHPVMGCGPGTYQFLYASYQRSYQLSTISTNAGNLGNAHSEYIGPLTEQGVVGVAIVVAVFCLTFVTGVRVYRTARDRGVANMALAFTLSLLTYYIHGFFNNFLDTDKLSVPFWGFTAVIVALDLYSEKKQPADDKQQEAQQP